MFISFDPRQPLYGLIRQFKGRSSRILRDKYPELKSRIPSHRKLKSRDGTFEKINTREVKASQYNHLNKLSHRWNYMDHNDKEIKVRRDLYSAFLIKNVNSDLNTINNKRCIDSFDDFLVVHDRETERSEAFKK